MLDKRILIPAALLVAIALTSLDFFFLNKTYFFFYIHSLATSLVGLSLIFFSYKLLKSRSGNKYINIAIMIMGISQASIHIALLFIGRCS